MPTPARRELFSANRQFRLEILSVDRWSRSREPPEPERPPPGRGTAKTTDVSWADRGKTTRTSTWSDGRLTALELETTQGEPPVATMRLYKGKDTRPLWQRDLAWVPGSAVVSDSGRHVATFDHWAASGTTPQVVVLFDAAGNQQVALSLSDLFTSAEQEKLTRSVSSIWWAAGLYDGDRVPHAFSSDEKHLVLKVQLDGHTRPNLVQPAPQQRLVEVSTGKVLR